MTLVQNRPIIRVRWTDSGMHVDHGWAPLVKYTEGVSSASTAVETVGILMHEDEEVVLVGLSYDPTHDHWFGAQMILKSNVLSQELL